VSTRAILFAISVAIAASGASEEKRRALEPTEDELAAFQLQPGAIESVKPFPESSALFQISGVGMFALSAADVATTEIGLARGLTEGNPAASNRALRLVQHVAGPAAVYWTTERLRRNGKEKLALALRIALVAAYGYATVHNLRQVGGLPASF
jgi:hypothetical protein